MISDKEMRKRIADMSPEELLKASETFEALFDLVHQHDDNSIAITNPDVSMTQDVLMSIKTSQSVDNNNPDYYKHSSNPWIPIANGKLPDKFQACIVLDKNKHVHSWIHDDALLPLFAQYTHWMPLPEPPEAE